MMLLGMWTIGEGATYWFASQSTDALMPAGAYCFFDFGSLLIYAWFTPVMVITLFASTFFYIRIFSVAQETNRNLENMSNFTRGPQIPTAKVARRSIVFIVGFFVGWFPAVVMCIHTLITGQRNEYMDLVLAICGSLHSVFVPVAYGWTNPRFHRWLAHYALFRRCIRGYKLKQKQSHKTVVTKWSSDVLDVRRIKPDKEDVDLRSKSRVDEELRSKSRAEGDLRSKSRGSGPFVHSVAFSLPPTHTPTTINSAEHKVLQAQMTLPGIVLPGDMGDVVVAS